MKKTISLIFFLLAANLMFAQSELAPELRTLQTEIQNGLACYCGCGMTIQGCLGGMTCSESRTVSKQVATLLQNGKGKAEVLQAMVAQYGEKILAAPTKEGFNLTAWILPFVALAVGGLIVARIISHWKQQTPQKMPAAAPVANPEEKTALDPYQERLERELREYDAK
ncbi:MAG: cytochrome c-type biogenesis protein CcmH [candidate division KSB1 bacterium]|nr:cytochrome c-type biogenesis protein CcmH [candidate division KSB1 bacterium]MDZ7367862.1 cytochrome c-type biogenesis protein CcmH [candidate division KSB1 bacterium]MDZ7405538.1 cytochrome c-type biogenesis protein CcmH [candidate division KSB1 bacterium]